MNLFYFLLFFVPPLLSTICINTSIVDNLCNHPFALVTFMQCLLTQSYAENHDWLKVSTTKWLSHGLGTQLVFTHVKVACLWNNFCLFIWYHQYLMFNFSKAKLVALLSKDISHKLHVILWCYSGIGNRTRSQCFSETNKNRGTRIVSNVFYILIIRCLFELIFPS